MILDIYIGNEKLELFEDENISITSSILDIQDISKNTTDYTKSFTVPASEINNKIFKHYYNANIDNTFDARVSVDGRIEIGGMPFRLGRFLLLKVSVKGGVASAYTINFWGNLVSLKEVLGDDKLADLDLSAYDHDYDGANVKSKLEVQTDYEPLIYTLLSKKRYYYDSFAGDETMTDSLANIHYYPGTANGVRYDDLKPSLALFSILQAIEDDYGLTFSDDFFSTDEFKKLYLWLNNSVNTKAGGSSVVADFTSGSTVYFNLTTNIGTFNSVGQAGESGLDWFVVLATLSPKAGFEDVEYTFDVYDDTELLGSVNGIGTQLSVVNLTSNSVGGDPREWLIHYELSTDSAFEYEIVCEQFKNAQAHREITNGEGSVDSFFTTSRNVPDIKIIDLLKGLFNAFKLVVIPQDDGTIFVDTVVNYYASGQILDLTKYIDIETVDVSRGDVLNTISYKFQEPTTILNIQFKENNQIAYGDEDAELRDENGKLLDGGSIDIELPFEQIVYERLTDTNKVDDIQLMYGAIIDTNGNPVNPKPHIFYRQIYKIGRDGIGFIDEDGVKTQIKDEINTSSHVIDDADPTNGFVFSEEFNEFNGALITNNLYSNYHQEYVESLFSIKKRNFVFNTKILPVSILLDLTLNDVLKIGNNYYRIDKFTTDLTTGKTQFNLVNL